MNTLAVIGLVVVAFALGWFTRDPRVLRAMKRSNDRERGIPEDNDEDQG